MEDLVRAIGLSASQLTGRGFTHFRNIVTFPIPCGLVAHISHVNDKLGLTFQTTPPAYSIGLARTVKSVVIKPGLARTVKSVVIKLGYRFIEPYDPYTDGLPGFSFWRGATWVMEICNPAFDPIDLIFCLIDDEDPRRVIANLYKLVGRPVSAIRY